AAEHVQAGPGSRDGRGALGWSARRREGALEGHLSPRDPLSPRAAFEQLSKLTRGMVRYEPREIWEMDTALLPHDLAKLRRELRAFGERELRPLALSIDAAEGDAHGASSPRVQELLSVAGRAGLLSDMLPRPLGGAAPSLFRHPLPMAASLKTEELSAIDGGLMLAICAHGLGVAPLLLSGELGKIRRFLLPAMRANLEGETHLFAFAITEPAAGSDVEEGHGAAQLDPGTIARRRQGGWSLRGRKCFISGGDLAKSTLVFAALEGEDLRSWTAFLVPHDAPGYHVVRTEQKMGMRASAAAELELEEVFVPDAQVIGGLRGGWALNRATLNLSRLPVAAMGVGFARAATEAAMDFACAFSLGGKPLIAYQDVQLSLSQMLATTQAARAMVWSAASRRQPIQREASAAKAFCTDSAIEVTTRAMDLLGNHAVLHTERVEKIYRDARLTQIFEGTNQINRLAMIEDIQEQLGATIERLRGTRA
ncbi:MAG: acyl-CoA/acyl-ACP dehydrogenase, partial [Myxococcales bacterium]|nr:acyl-CoA/acyl-ACP dehydrogenase [Myxococcales bacterium]